MIISFSLTLKLAEKLEVPEPLKAGIKTVTRRNWSDKTFDQITKAYDQGRKQHSAWNNCSFVPGACPIGIIELTHRPYWEKLGDMPESDVFAEGNLWASKKEFIKMLRLPLDKKLCVVRFQFKQ
ncbi:hypothetical protein NIES4074_36340 [Cylindrospermum sp. NIES-4074]|nr:hypothetical protein NIES4074_36340 [Cylindrospermum sp. NIES-4074]